MVKLSTTKEQIERLIVAELKTFAGCKSACGVIVVPLNDPVATATWTVSCFKAGSSDGEACDHALQHIVPRFQRIYDLVQIH